MTDRRPHARTEVLNVVSALPREFISKSQAVKQEGDYIAVASSHTVGLCLKACAVSQYQSMYQQIRVSNESERVDVL